MEAFLATAAHDLRAPLTAGRRFLDSPSADRAAGSGGAGGAPRACRRADAVGARLTMRQRARSVSALLACSSTPRRSARASWSCTARRSTWWRWCARRSRRCACGACAHHPPATPQVRGASESIVVEADADRIGQVVTNYVTNALKYSPPDQQSMSVWSCPRRCLRRCPWRWAEDGRA